MDYGSLIWVALQRSRSARECYIYIYIYIIVDLANKYGYASEGESLSIADKDDVWYVDGNDREGEI